MILLPLVVAFVTASLDPKPAPSAQMTVDGKSFTIYEVSGGEPYADIAANDIGPDNVQKKHVDNLHYKPIQFRLDPDGFANLRPWISAAFATPSTAHDGQIVYHGHQVAFTRAIITHLGFPLGTTDSGLVAVTIDPETVRITNTKTADPQPRTSKPFTGTSVTVDGLGNPTMDGLLSPLDYQCTVAENLMGATRDYQKHPAKVTLSDIDVVQSNAKKGGLADWIEPWFITGHHLEADERTAHITYFRGTTALFTLDLANCGLKEVSANFRDDDRTAATLYTEHITLATGPANTKPAEAAPAKALAPSEDGTFGQAYYADAAQTLSLNVQSLAYRGDRYVCGLSPQTANIWIPSPEQKLVVLTVRVTNLGQAEATVGFERAAFSIDDDQNLKVRGIASAFRLTDQLDYNAPLAPGASIDLQYIALMSGTAAAKRMAVWGADPAQATTYDLVTNHVEPLPALLAAPADKSGATLLPEIASTLNTWLPTGYLDINIDKVSTTGQPIRDTAPNEGEEYVLIHCRIRNAYRAEVPLNYETVRFHGYDKDGHEFVGASPVNESLKADANRTFAPVGKDGSEGAVAYFFAVPKGTKLSRLTVQELTGHVYAIRL